MLHRILCHCQSRQFGHQHALRRKAGAPPRSLRLLLEPLEDRLTPSTIPVTSSADSGPGSLRAVIASAPPGSTIVFAPSVHAITLTSGQLAISKTLDIEGPGADKLTISGNNASRVFHIEGASTVTIANLTVAHGQSSGQLPASDVGVYEGTGSGAGGGGGILNEAGGNLTLRQDKFDSNQAVGAVGFTVVGGALLNLGTANVLACQFSNNQSVGGGAFDAIGGSGGGAIDNFGNPAGGAILTVVASTFSNNSGVAAGGGFYFGLGGAIENDGGLNSFDPSMVEPSRATITNSAFFGNLVTGGPTAIGNGGALSNFGGTTTMVACTVNGNRSVGGGGGDGVTTGDSEGIGGGMYNALGTLNVSGCTITGNQAIGAANAILSAADPFAGAGVGGGIENNFQGVLNISNSTVAGNIAQGGATTNGPGGDAFGGGISNSPAFPGGTTTMTMTNCLVASNQAIAGPGGPGVNSLLGNLAAGFAFGGGVDTSHGSIATISGSLIIGNHAVGGAGGNGNNGGDGLGGGLSVGIGDLTGFPVPDSAQVTLINTVDAGNLALGGTGGAGANGGDGLGGGLYVSASCSATVNASTIAFNVALGGEEGAGGSDGKGIGGGIYNLGSNLTIDALSAVFANHASTDHDNIFP